MADTRAWETIDTTTERLWVPGGWLVRSSAILNSGNSVAVVQTFIADENHLWDLKTCPQKTVS